MTKNLAKQNRSYLIVVPCYNEAKRLDCEAFKDFIGTNSDVDFLFVDDGSLDHTFEILRGLASHSHRFQIFKLEVNSGKAEAVRVGILKGIDDGYQNVGYWDADLATPLSEITNFISYLKNHNNTLLLMGSRVKLLGRRIERKMHRHYLGRVFATFVSLVLDIPVYDTQCGAKIFKVNKTTRNLFSKPFNSKWIFDVEILARWKIDQDIVAIEEFPLLAWQDVAGSKLKPLDFLTAIRELFNIYRKY